MSNNNLINNIPNNNLGIGIAYFDTGELLNSLSLNANGKTIIGYTGSYPHAGDLSSPSSSITITKGANTLDLKLNDNGASSSGFLATQDSITANATGDGTNWIPPMATVIYDILSEYNNTTYTFTASATGYYFFKANFYMNNLAAVNDELQCYFISTSVTSQFGSLDPGYMRNLSDSAFGMGGYNLYQLDASDTVYTLISVSGDFSASVGVGGSAGNVNTGFCGWRVG
jgi:hypothetical protein